MNRKSLLLEAREALCDVTTEAYTDSLTLLGSVLNIPRTQLLAYIENPVAEDKKRRFLELVERRCQGEPLAYLTRQVEFWAHSFYVTAHCLIPRADTEIIIEQILKRYAAYKKIRVLELGTGSGIIANTLKLERPTWEITATDQCIHALKIAKQNASKLGAHIHFKSGNWFEAVKPNDLFDVVVSNPPYLSQNDPHLKGPLRFEPQAALVAGASGIEALRHLIQTAPRYLKPNGYLFLEQGFDQAERVHVYFKACSYKEIRQYRDLNGILRITCGRR